MKTQVRTLPVLIVAAGCLVLGSTAGAVAGAQITGAQIKNGTVTSSDVKNRTLLTKDLARSTITALKGSAGSPGLQGRQEVNTSVALAANTPRSNLTATCPAGKVAIGGSGFWTSSSEAVQFVINLNAVRAFTPGIPTADTLNVRAICVDG